MISDGRRMQYVSVSGVPGLPREALRPCRHGGHVTKASHDHRATATKSGMGSRGGGAGCAGRGGAAWALPSGGPRMRAGGARDGCARGADAATRDAGKRGLARIQLAGIR